MRACIVCMKLIATHVLYARTLDSFVSVGAWGSLRYRLLYMLSLLTAQDDGVEPATKDARANGSHQEITTTAYILFLDEAAAYPQWCFFSMLYFFSSL